MKTYRLKTAIFLFAMIAHYFALPQQKKLKYYLNEDSSRSVGFAVAGQAWMRYNENNPGTLSGDQVDDASFDVSIRRVRIATYAKLNAKTFLFVCLGRNDFNQSSDKGGIDLLDFHIDYQLTPWFAIGGGKSGWRGLSRYSAPSPTKMLGADVLLAPLTTVNIGDQLTRSLGFYGKGSFNKFDYRLSVASPYKPANVPLLEDSNFDPKSNHLRTSGYMRYQFFEKESMALPYALGTYYGAKRVFNIGVGFEYQPDAMCRQNLSMDTIFHDISHYAVDMFYESELPGTRGLVATLYAAYFNYNFGRNYVRNIGVNNISSNGNNDVAFNGVGNSYPTIGTGDSYYMQSALFFPLTKDKKPVGIQPYFGIQLSDFDKLNENMIWTDYGINFLLNGHNSKFALAMQRRPIYRQVNDQFVVDEFKNMFILQYQFRFD